MQSLTLSAALDALDRPIGLPSSVLGKAEEVRLEDGMHRLPILIEDVQRLTRRDSVALDKVRFQLPCLMSSPVDFRSSCLLRHEATVGPVPLVRINWSNLHTL
jgi:hypothetical protein